MEESSPARLTAAEVQDTYSRLLPLYSFWEKLTEGKAMTLAFEWANVQPGERVLEVAVGPGTVLEKLVRSNPGGLTVGVDLTPAMLHRTARRFRGQALQPPGLCQCDARSLPFAEESFDLVFCGYLLDLLPLAEIERVLREMRRVVRPSGRLVLSHLGLGDACFDRVWGWLCWTVPTLVGGCRPIRVGSDLPRLNLQLLQARRVVQLGIPTEVILARRVA